jgi:peroxiredoxin Q/BCP
MGGASMINVGDKVPAFSLLDQNDQKVSSADLLGQKYVLYFYPKDLTPGCTSEAVLFDNLLEGFTEKGYRIYGVNKDSTESHRKFIGRYQLRFSLLSDPDGDFVEQMGMWQEKKNFGKTYYGVARSTFVIDENGIVTAVYHRVKPGEHARILLSELP